MRANRRDHNQATIVRTLERLGCSVFDASRVGDGFPDLVIAFRGRTHLLDVKNPETAYGRRGLNKHQKDFQRRWFDEIYVASSEEQAEALVMGWIEEATFPDGRVAVKGIDYE